MSKYLKWYDSYLDHTPTEDLAKNEIESAHRKIKHAIESLEKANQSVAELQQTVATLEKELLRQCTFMEKTAEKLEQHREWQATASVLRRPTREAKQALNKFAIEKKIEGVVDFCATLQGFEDVHPIGANYVTSVAAHRDSFIEQLRKEQD